MTSVFPDIHTSGSAGKAAPHREIARSLPPREAVEYLLEVIDAMTASMAIEWELPGVHLTPTERRIFRAIASGHGETVARDAVYAQLVAGRPDCDWPDDRSLDVYILNLRRKLAGSYYAIRTIYGQGWRVFAPVGTVWPWEAAR